MARRVNFKPETSTFTVFNGQRSTDPNVEIDVDHPLWQEIHQAFLADDIQGGDYATYPHFACGHTFVFSYPQLMEKLEALFT